MRKQFKMLLHSEVILDLDDILRKKMESSCSLLSVSPKDNILTQRSSLSYQVLTVMPCTLSTVYQIYTHSCACVHKDVCVPTHVYTIASCGWIAQRLYVTGGTFLGIDRSFRESFDLQRPQRSAVPSFAPLLECSF